MYYDVPAMTYCTAGMRDDADIADRPELRTDAADSNASINHLPTGIDSKTGLPISRTM